MISTFREWVVQNQDTQVVPEDASINEIADDLIAVAEASPGCDYPGCEQLQYVDSEYCCQGHEMLHDEHGDTLEEWTVEEKLDRLGVEWGGVEISFNSESSEWTIENTGDGDTETVPVVATSLEDAVDRALIETVFLNG